MKSVTILARDFGVIRKRYRRQSLADYPVSQWCLVLGLLLICTVLAMTAAISLAGPERITGVRLRVVVLLFVGAALVGFGPMYKMVHE